jgi:hypothetical protein
MANGTIIAFGSCPLGVNGRREKSPILSGEKVNVSSNSILFDVHSQIFRGVIAIE